MWQRNESVWKISVLYLEMLNRRILSVASLIIDKDKKIPRRNDSLNIDHENCRLDLATRIDLIEALVALGAAIY